jgi:hypothetical protein
MSDMEDEGFSLAQEMAAFGDDLLGKAYPAAEYDMDVVKAVASKTAGGKHAIKLTLKFIGGKFVGKTVFEQLNWSPESDIAAKIFAQALAKMGATQEWIKSTKPSMAQVAAKIEGAKVRVKLTEDSFNGIPRNKVSFMSTIALGGGGSANGGVTVSKDEVEDLVAEADAASDEPPVTVPDSSDAVDLDWP